jgi:peptide/nickel transport system substrate-binding protein
MPVRGGARAVLIRGVAAALMLSGAMAVAPAATTAAGGRMIVFGLQQEPYTLSPLTGPFTTAQQIVCATMFTNLFVLEPSGKLQLGVASEIPTVKNGGISKNGLVYTFHLKPGLKWSDGAPITSTDVYETYRLSMASQVNAITRLGFSDISKFQILSPTEFRITLKSPYAPLLTQNFATCTPGIIPWHIYKKIPLKDINTSALNQKPTVDDGAYVLQSWKPGVSLTVTPNPHWWGPKPQNAGIQFDVIADDATELADAQAHTINVYWFVPIEQVPQLKKIHGETVDVYPAPSFEYVAINFRNPILRSLDVREALEYAIDREALVKQVWDGDATLLAADQPPISWGHNPHLKPLPFDPQKARQLLDAAGWKLGPGGHRYKDGKELTLIYSTTTGNPWRQTTERLVQYWLGQVGINLQIKNYPSNVYFGSVLPSGKGWDLGEFGNQNQPDAGVITYDSFVTGGVFNEGAYSNAQVDALLNKQQSLTSQSARQKILWRVESILAKTVAALFYYSPDQIVAWSGISGYVPNAWYEDTWNAYAWRLTS